MRIKVLRTPTSKEVDGVRLDTFRPGLHYEVGHALGALFVAEGWGEPISPAEPPLATPLDDFNADARTTRSRSNLVRETVPPYYELGLASPYPRVQHPPCPACGSRDVVELIVAAGARKYLCTACQKTRLVSAASRAARPPVRPSDT